MRPRSWNSELRSMMAWTASMARANSASERPGRARRAKVAGLNRLSLGKSASRMFLLSVPPSVEGAAGSPARAFSMVPFRARLEFLTGSAPWLSKMSA